MFDMHFNVELLAAYSVDSGRERSRLIGYFSQARLRQKDPAFNDCKVTIKKTELKFRLFLSKHLKVKVNIFCF